MSAAYPRRRRHRDQPRLLEARLSAEYFEVVTATNGPAGARHLRARPVRHRPARRDDAGHGRLRGRRRLKADPATHHIPDRHGHRARPPRRPRARAGGRRRRFPDQARRRSCADRPRALPGAAEDGDRRAAHARGHLADIGIPDDRSPASTEAKASAAASWSSTTASASCERIDAALARRAHGRVSRPIRRRRCSASPTATTIWCCSSLELEQLRCAAPGRPGALARAHAASADPARRRPGADGAPAARPRSRRQRLSSCAPIDKNELVARVRTQIRRKRYTDQLRDNVQQSHGAGGHRPAHRPVQPPLHGAPCRHAGRPRRRRAASRCRCW